MKKASLILLLLFCALCGRAASVESLIETMTAIDDWCDGLELTAYDSSRESCWEAVNALSDSSTSSELSAAAKSVSSLEDNVATEVYTYLTYAIGNMCLKIQAIEEEFESVWVSGGYKKRANSEVYNAYTTPLYKAYSNAYVDGVLLTDYNCAEELARLAEIEAIIDAFVSEVTYEVTAINHVCESASQRVCYNINGMQVIGNQGVWQKIEIIDGKKVLRQ